MWDTVVQPAVIAALVVLGPAVWQVRMTVAARGRKRNAAALGQVVTNLDRPANVVGYGLGVYVGVAADGRLAAEPVEHRIVVPGDGARRSAALRAGGWPVTIQPAHGPDGPAAALSVVVAGGRSADVERALAGIDHGGLHTSSRLRTANWAAPEPVELRSV